MFTHNSIKWIVTFTLLTVVAFGTFRLPGAALADGPDGVVTDATTYITYLDSLREMGQTEAQIAQARYAREVAVFDHSSLLVSLNEKAIAVSRAANNRPVITDANGFSSHLDQLRITANTAPLDATGFISHLDQLRQKGQEAAQVNSAQTTLP